MSRVVTIPNFEDKSVMTLTRTPWEGGGGGVLPYMGIWVWAVGKGRVFKLFTLG